MKLTRDYINNLIARCHGASVAGGWWTDLATGESLHGKRNRGELLCLMHSEVSEAAEGVAGDLLDDKLPHRTMEEVELADVAIRLGDYAGGNGYDDLGAVAEEVYATGWIDDDFFSAADGLLQIHSAISATMEGARKNKADVTLPRRKAEEVWLFITLHRVFAYAEEYGLDVEGAIDEKISFNAQRDDHKPENRIKDDGKKF